MQNENEEIMKYYSDLGKFFYGMDTMQLPLA